MTHGEVLVATDGLKGFDCNAPVDAATARLMYAAGYRFAVRYVRRATVRPHDLSAEEVDTLLCAGLAVMPVQHVESDRSWTPSAAKGEAYGAAAATHAQECELPGGVTVWCDLEGVAVGVPMIDVDAYCRRWYAMVTAAGYEAGLYVGWHAGLTALQLYRLPFKKYWAAYNLDADRYPARVGVMMNQHAAKAADVPEGVDLEIDVDTIHPDALERLPTLFAPDGWPA